MGKANGKSYDQELDEIRDFMRMKAHHMMLVKMSKCCMRSELSDLCDQYNVKDENIEGAVLEFLRMPNNAERLYYLEAKKLVDSGVKINLI